MVLKVFDLNLFSLRSRFFIIRHTQYPMELDATHAVVYIWCIMGSASVSTQQSCQCSLVSGKIHRHVSARKSYLHFYYFAGEAILCSNFFCILLFFASYFAHKNKNTFDFRLEISFEFCISTLILHINKSFILPKMQLQCSCAHMTTCTQHNSYDLWSLAKALDQLTIY